METGEAARGPLWRGIGRASLVVVLCTGVCELISPRFDLANVIMIYLAGVVYVALHESGLVSVGTVIASIFLFDLLYVPPRWGLNPLNPLHFFTFAVMLVVGLLISRLAGHAREQARSAAAAQMQAESERLRNTLLSGISHDFRTPLTTIVGAATSLREQDDKLDAQMRRTLVESILREARHLGTLLGNVLDLTRMEEGAIQLHPEWCPLDDLVAEALESSPKRMPAADLEVLVPPNGIVWCDARLVQQAIVNLVDNAQRHTPLGTKVRIEADVQANEWHLVVSDDGPGLPPGQEQLVFRKFHRTQDESSHSGFGLGLAICAAVAKLHGGRIEALNAGGARFVMAFPQPTRADRAEP